MNSAASKFIASLALAGAVVLGGATGAFAQDNGSGDNGSGDPGGTTDTTAGPTTSFATQPTDTSLPMTGSEAALALGGAGALAGLAYAARRAAQSRI